MANEIKKKKVGKIYISSEIVFNHDIAELVFRNFYPYAIYPGENFTGKLYIGTSPFFEEIEEGSVIPLYNALVTTKEGKPDSITFNKIL